MSVPVINARHIQDYSAATALEPHWGYADRMVPCTNDAGSCAYLDATYSAHDVGMLYTGILWSAIAGILLIWAFLRQFDNPMISPAPMPSRQSPISRARRALSAWIRQYCLPEAPRLIFGRTTRLQVLVLASLAGYLLIFSFVGIVYNTWVTPVSGMDGVYNTRSSIGPWSDRVGVFAYALLPLSVMLSSRESLLSMITGLPYQSFNFLHRWLGYIIFVQSSLHTIMWCIVELRLYQPQPSVGIEWVTQTYIVWGIVAMVLLLLLFILSTPWGIRATGYETFRKVHYVLAMVFIGACWAHWEQLKCFLLPSLIFWFLDRGARLVRTALLHYHPDDTRALGFKTAEATITRYSDVENSDVIRLDLENMQEPWLIGQHYYLCFPQASIWQSHPFTPLNPPVVTKGNVRHSYILRAKSGETKKINDLATTGISTTSVILTGAYGEDITKSVTPDTNIICVAGGTGITYVLPVLLELARQSPVPDRKIELIWAVRHRSNQEWIGEELGVLQKVQRALNLQIKIVATRDSSDDTPALKDSIDVSVLNEKDNEISTSSESPSCGCEKEVIAENLGRETNNGNARPNLQKLIPGFLDEVVRGPTTVFLSGPGAMISEVRSIVASCNSGPKVWRGNDRFDVNLVCDDRLEW
ncbi:hypothetical protein N7492_005849 [Penicillium capsulatum]|uniref:FAD-binding FR-type domain-containing protein n=1 Tax=Penicillium capsulatum TaxID=69766 RepID=A0A9W9IAK8_9EURO|nr:hypothetical protein N7492_005849 [Penicillium capsulatum]KAJ6135051.1 hypothetical protein N7512_000211 [Penicillium capsulatum]